jgi:hypothetical protein
MKATCMCLHGTRRHHQRKGACALCYCPEYQRRELPQNSVLTFEPLALRDRDTGAYL